MEYRFSKNRPEIIKALENNLTTECQLTVWQKNDDGSRSLLEKMSFLALYPNEGVFTLNVPREFIKAINPKKDIYLLLEGLDFIFKTIMAISQKDHMTLQIPKEVRLEELRLHKREYFTLEDRKFVEVSFRAKNTDHKIKLTCPLINISEGGACIAITKETISNIDISAEVLVKLTADFQKAIIRNARLFVKKNLNNDELYAIGVQFQ